MNKKILAQIAAYICFAIILLVLFYAMQNDTSINPVSAQESAQDPPVVTTVVPNNAPNDLDTLIIISGTGFSATITNSVVITQPTVMLGDVQLTDAIWVSTTMLTATVPWGMNTGSYDLTVINPDGASGSLANAFNVTLGIGQWNGANLFGGEGRQILMKPGDPNTVYALASEVGIYRSRDAGEHWRFIYGKVLGNKTFVIDPLHPTWLYIYAYDGLYRSQDEGDTWIKLFDTWPDGRPIGDGGVYPSSHNDQVLFISSSINPGDPPPEALGLSKSTDGGVSWTIVAHMEGISVQDVDFHPTDPMQLVLATSSGQVFQSIDGGDTWSDVNRPPLGNIRSISYNPFKPTEVWITLSDAGGIYKSMDTDFTWSDVTPASGYDMWVKFINADSVYTRQNHSADGGLTWQQFGPPTGYGEVGFNPENSLIGFIGDNTYAVQKTLDGGQTWEIKNQGLTGMIAYQIETSRFDPLRVYAIFGSWPGIYRTDDGANSWRFLPIAGSGDVSCVREDPFYPQSVYAASYSGFSSSPDGGQSWENLGWNITPPWEGGPNVMEVDPINPGHLLVGFAIGSDDFHLSDRGQLYSSTDFGVSWQAITVTQDLELGVISSIVFHPDIQGLVYLTTGGTGVYQSVDYGDHWIRIDDLQQPDMALALNLTIATHPQPILLVGTGSQYPYRSTDGGVTWERAQNSQGGIRFYMFLEEDSTRLYIATWFGLLFSSDAGDTWEPAAGVLGKLNVSVLDYTVDYKNNYTILYAATNGGNPNDNVLHKSSNLIINQTTEGIQAKSIVVRDYSSISVFVPLVNRQSEAPSNLVDAGIYRFVSH